MATKAKVAVHVVVDTNALFTEAADKLLANEISELISGTSANLELNVHWHLPWIVKAERQYQMNQRARKLLPQLEKVEKLLGHQLGITEDVLHKRVVEAIQRQIDFYKLQEITFDKAEIDLQQLAERSVFRLPPFDPGESEKGFRDALLLETFCQLVKTLPKTPSVCRIVLLSNDQLLSAAASERLSDRSNVFFIGDIESLKTMLNALAAELTQEMVNSILPKAQALFFEPDNSEALYYKAKVRDTIYAKFSRELSTPPAGDFSVKITGIRIGAPTFLSKAGQILSFSSRIVFRLEAIKYFPSAGTFTWSTSSYPSPSLSGADLTGSTYDILKAGNLTPGVVGPLMAGSTSSTNLAVASPVQEVKREGEAIFEVTWTVTLKSTSGSLAGPRFVQVSHKSTDWKS